jgi:uncharacterized protein
MLTEELSRVATVETGKYISEPKELIGRVAEMWRYPVKSMMGEEIDCAYVTGHGMLGDRAYALIDRATGKVASAKNPRKWPGLFGFKAAYCAPPSACDEIPPVMIALPDGGSFRSDSPGLDCALTSVLDREVSLTRGAPEKVMLEEYWPDMDDLAHRDAVTDEAMPPATFFDCAPMHLLTRATLAKLSALYPDGSFVVRRFRPNFVIATDSGAVSFAEQSWVGRTITIGPEVRLKITIGTGRCVMTTLPQGDLPRDLGILKTAVQHNGGQVGVYATVVRGGTVRSSDEVRLE